MDVTQIYVNADGQWWEAFEYHKHHHQEFPDACSFIVPTQDTDRADQIFLAAMAKVLSEEMRTL